jgi:hypothetical protein
MSPLFIGAITVAAGTAAAVWYGQAGLALAHYDARAHLVVARRVLDSLVPGWQQIGAVWLPLPHVLNMLPVQVDSWYRTGASAIAISVLSTGMTTWAIARLLIGFTGSRVAAAASAALLLVNPSVLYLQSTPMTEPLLLATVMLSILFTAEWVDRGAPLPPRAAGWAIVAACMTRYEALPVCSALIGLAWTTLLWRGMPVRAATIACARLAAYPAVALVLFTLNSRWTTGFWFVPSGFFVPENEALGNASLAFDQVRESLYRLSGTAWVWPACAGATLLVWTFFRSKDRSPLVLALAIAAAAVIPWYAYYQGHPLRVRYGFPLILACSVMTGAGIALLWAPCRPLAAAAVLAWALSQASPLDRQSPLVAESQRDAVNKAGRAAVTAYLQANWDGSTIMMSMGSLAHYMHDLSHVGLNIRDFLQEGNEQLWIHAAARGPRGFVRWVVIEEKAEGGDVLYQAAARNPQFLEGFERVADGGGVALYRAR